MKIFLKKMLKSIRKVVMAKIKQITRPMKISKRMKCEQKAFARARKRNKSRIFLDYYL